jgi:hypothetical protein
MRKTLYVKPFGDQLGAREKIDRKERWSNDFNMA